MTSVSGHSVPVMYTFRRCPYAIRARLAIASAGVTVAIREIHLRNKPAAMLALSPKATVPVLHLPNGNVIDESLDIMHWALSQHDPEQWLKAHHQDHVELLQLNDGHFKYYLDRYKYADRYPDHSVRYYQQQGELFLAILERRLSKTRYLCDDYFSFADAAIAPFIRQFSAVDPDWFNNAAYPAVRQWLTTFLASHCFASIMKKYAPWSPGDPILLFNSKRKENL